jgi:hypothetical protein
VRARHEASGEEAATEPAQIQALYQAAARRSNP